MIAVCPRCGAIEPQCYRYLTSTVVGNDVSHVGNMECAVCGHKTDPLQVSAPTDFYTLFEDWYPYIPDYCI